MKFQFYLIRTQYVSTEPCTIAETGSLTKAAEILNISHSGLSKAISVLETETKLKLFRPLGRGLEITNEGKWFYQKAQQMLKIENEISLGVKTEETCLRIGLSEVIAITCAGILSRELRQSLTILEADVGESAVYMPDFVAFFENEKLTEKMQLLKIPEHKMAESRRKLFLVKAKNSEETKEMKKAAKVLRNICCRV